MVADSLTMDQVSSVTPPVHLPLGHLADTPRSSAGVGQGGRRHRSCPEGTDTWGEVPRDVTGTWRPACSFSTRPRRREKGWPQKGQLTSCRAGPGLDRRHLGRGLGDVLDLSGRGREGSPAEGPRNPSWGRAVPEVLRVPADSEGPEGSREFPA